MLLVLYILLLSIHQSQIFYSELKDTFSVLTLKWNADISFLFPKLKFFYSYKAIGREWEAPTHLNYYQFKFLISTDIHVQGMEFCLVSLLPLPVPLSNGQCVIENTQTYTVISALALLPLLSLNSPQHLSQSKQEVEGSHCHWT